MILLCTTTIDVGNEGTLSWSGKVFENIRQYLPSTKKLLTITKGILSLPRTAKAFEVSLKVLRSTNTSLAVHYTVSSRYTYTPYQIRKALCTYLAVKSVSELPFCVAVDEEKFRMLLQQSAIVFRLQEKMEKNDWSGMHAVLQSLEPIEKSIHWNNPELLQLLSFATAKLSECTENLKKKFPSKQKREEFLTEKRLFRQKTLLLRKRCIELQPTYAPYYATLGYTHYQSVLELSTPGGRRDGSLQDEALQAVRYFDKALLLDEWRITEYYRKGTLLVLYLPNTILFAPNNEALTMETRITQAYEFFRQGLQTFEKGIQAYEQIPQFHSGKARFRKYYIKCLYHLARGNVKLGKAPQNIFVSENSTDIRQQRIDSLRRAEQWFQRMLEADAPKPDLSFVRRLEANGILCAVYKAYLYATIHLSLYVLTKQPKHKTEALQYFTKASELSFPRELQKQNKLFVLEKMAQLYIAAEEYAKAITVLEPFYRSGKFFPDYAAYTLARAYALAGKREECRKICDTYSANPHTPFHTKFRELQDFSPQGNAYTEETIDFLNKDEEVE